MTVYTKSQKPTVFIHPCENFASQLPDQNYYVYLQALTDLCITMVKLIGTNAGLVWRALNKAGRMSVKELKKETKLKTDKELFAAIGWLAKEGKLESEEKNSEFFFWLS